jgi:hypothetical protein
MMPHSCTHFPHSVVQYHGTVPWYITVVTYLRLHDVLVHLPPAQSSTLQLWVARLVLPECSTSARHDFLLPIVVWHVHVAHRETIHTTVDHSTTVANSVNSSPTVACVAASLGAFRPCGVADSHYLMQGRDSGAAVMYSPVGPVILLSYGTLLWDLADQ